MLKASSVNAIAKVLSPEVISYIENKKQEEFMELIQDSIVEFIDNNLGDIDEGLKFDIVISIMDRIYLTTYKD